MPNVLDVKIDESIVLDPKRLVNSKGKIMPIDIQDNVKLTMTIYCERHDCHWSALTWTVSFDKSNPGMPIISVKRK